MTPSRLARWSTGAATAHVPSLHIARSVLARTSTAEGAAIPLRMGTPKAWLACTQPFVWLRLASHGLYLPKTSTLVPFTLVEEAA